jgi:chitin deacetylase
MRSRQLFGEPIRRIDTTERIAALTFDDGPGRKHTARVLSMPDTLKVRATFYLTGNELERNPDLPQRSVTDLRARGYLFVGVDELLAMRNITANH